MGITRTGVPRRTRRAFESWTKDIEDDIKRVIKETLMKLEAELKARMPSDTGAMQESISVDFDANGLGGKLQIGAFYAIYVNYGTGIHAQGPGGSRAKKIPWVYFNERWGRFVLTHGQPAQFFWEPSIDEASDFFVREMNKIGK